MVKAAKIDDVKRPERVLPSATSRPILVTDQSAAPAGDPMLATPEDTGQSAGAASDASVLSHTARTIAPLSAPTVTPAQEEEPTLKVATPEPSAAKPATVPEVVPETKPVAEAITVPSEAKQEVMADAAKDDDEEGAPRDPDAAQTAAEAAVAEAASKREAEIEKIVSSGKYAVPINAVQRKRSRIATSLLCLLALVLTAALLDAVFDIGLISAPTGVPHTHFFSK